MVGSLQSRWHCARKRVEEIALRNLDPACLRLFHLLCCFVSEKAARFQPCSPNSKGIQRAALGRFPLLQKLASLSFKRGLSLSEQEPHLEAPGCFGNKLYILCAFENLLRCHQSHHKVPVQDDNLDQLLLIPLDPLFHTPSVRRYIFSALTIMLA